MDAAQPFAFAASIVTLLSGFRRQRSERGSDQGGSHPAPLIPAEPRTIAARVAARAIERRDAAHLVCASSAPPGA
jgi:hypothetical protein